MRARGPKGGLIWISGDKRQIHVDALGCYAESELWFLAELQCYLNFIPIIMCPFVLFRLSIKHIYITYHMYITFLLCKMKTES